MRRNIVCHIWESSCNPQRGYHTKNKENCRIELLITNQSYYYSVCLLAKKYSSHEHPFYLSVIDSCIFSNCLYLIKTQKCNLRKVWLLFRTCLLTIYILLGWAENHYWIYMADKEIKDCGHCHDTALLNGNYDVIASKNILYFLFF